MNAAAAGGGGVGIRLFVSGGEVVKRSFDQIADSGRKMWAEVALGQRAANPAVRALSAGVGEARNGIEAFAGRAGIAGTALGAFGVAGLGAAVALAGVAAGLAKAREAMAFADEIDDAANKLDIGTTALQQYRYAMIAVGGSAQDADTAIQSFTSKLGEAQAGGRALKWFERLGFTREQLQSYETAEEALGDVIGRLAGLNKETERAAVSSKIGLGSMLALTREGEAGVAALMQSALDLGYVLDEELVTQGAAANQRFEEMSTIIDVQLKSAFVSLAPVILELGGFLTDLARTIADVADSWRDLDQRSTQGLRRQDQRLAQAQLDLLEGQSSPNDLRGYQKMRWDGINIQRARIAVQLQGRGDREPGNEGGQELDDPATSDRRGGRGSDHSAAARREDREAEQRADRLTRFEDQREDLSRRILRATDDEFRSLSERAGLEVSGLALALDQRRRTIERAVLEHERTEGLRGLSRVEADQLIAKEEELAAIETSRVDWRERRELAARRLDAEEQAAENAIALLEIDEALATNGEARHRIEREILELTQEMERKRRKQVLDADPNLDDAARDEQMKMFTAIQARQTALFEVQEQTRLREEFKSYGREVVEAIQDGRIGEYIGERIKERLLDGALNSLFNNFFSGREETGGGLIGSLVRFGSGLFKDGGGRAAGGDVRDGMAYRMAEHGPELLLMGTKGQVTSAAETAKMVKELAGPGSGPQGSMPAPIINLPPITINAQGADAAGLARVERAVHHLNDSIEQRAIEAVADYQQRRHGRF